MGRVAYMKNNSIICYIDDYEIGSQGYLIDYTKGNTDRDISFQCKVKVVDYMIFGTIINCKKAFIEMKKSRKGPLYKQFILRYLDHMILVCVKQISDWEVQLLTPDQINKLIIFEKRDF